MILPKHSIYGDYNAAFNIKTLIALQGPPNTPNTKPITLSSGQKEYFTCFTMNCDVEVFCNLMELYPETAENIKIRALEKREVYMYYLQKTRKFYKRKFGEKVSPDDEKKFKKWRRKDNSTYDG